MHELILPCKSYVKRYLINQFGNPVDLRKNRHYYDYLKLLIQRKICRFNKRTHIKPDGSKSSLYSHSVKIIIDDDTFNRFGFDLTPTSVVKFNTFIEDSIKTQARLFIFTSTSFGHTRVNAIQDFQDAFGFSEDEFPAESITKDLQRHSDFEKKFKKTFGTSVQNYGTCVHQTG